MATPHVESQFSETTAAQIILERAEDEIKRVIEHYQNPYTNRDKAAEVVIKIKVTSDDKAAHFGFEIAAAPKFAPRKTDETDMYGSLEDGKVEMVEFRQHSLSLTDFTP